MKRLLVFLILPLQLFSQTAIDQIRSDSDVVNFIRTQGRHFADSMRRKYMQPVTFDINGRTSIYRQKLDSADGQLADSMMARRWIVEDFTGDRQKDLVFYGRIGTETGVFIFFYGTGNASHLIQLTDLFASHYPHSIALHKINGVNALVLGSLRQPDFTKTVKPFRERYYLDTLVYTFGYFAEYNKTPKPAPAFDSIDYNFITNWVAVNKWGLRLYKNGTVVYVHERDSITEEKQYVPVLEKLTTTVDAKEWQALLGYINFTKLNDNYELQNVSDLTTAVTTVYFSDGTKKSVRDYGGRGTFGLQTLYNKIYALRTSHDWKLEKRTTGYWHDNPGF